MISQNMKALVPTTQVVMLTVYEDTENIFNALAAGASGYLLKRTKSAELLDAIRTRDPQDPVVIFITAYDCDLAPFVFTVAQLSP